MWILSGVFLFFLFFLFHIDFLKALHSSSPSARGFVLSEGAERSRSDIALKCCVGAVAGFSLTLSAVSQTKEAQSHPRSSTNVKTLHVWVMYEEGEEVWRHLEEETLSEAINAVLCQNGNPQVVELERNSFPLLVRAV